MTYGLKDTHIDKIKGVFAQYPKLQEVILYGSRAKGTHKHASDIDLVLKGDDLTLHDLYSIEQALDDLLLPWKMDVSLYHHIDNQQLLAHIERVGVVFYAKREEVGE